MMEQFLAVIIVSGIMFFMLSIDNNVDTKW